MCSALLRHFSLVSGLNFPRNTQKFNFRVYFYSRLFQTKDETQNGQEPFYFE